MGTFMFRLDNGDYSASCGWPKATLKLAQKTNCQSSISSSCRLNKSDNAGQATHGKPEI